MDVLVVGAGLAGLTAARTLSRAGRQVQVLEARTRVGGRMHTIPAGETARRGWFDLGATWHWDDQPRIRALAAELGIDIFPQYDEGRVLKEGPYDESPSPLELPPPPAAELRFVGGAQPLCERLAGQLPDGTVRLGMVVDTVARDGSQLAVTAYDADNEPVTLTGDFVLLTVPPRLVLETMRFIPELPDDLVQAIEGTPTWMGEAIKATAVYSSPFWRDAGLSGAALSEAGPLSEVHDGSTADGSLAVLWGFVDFDHDHRMMEVDERAPLVLAQLERLFGPPGGEPLQYFERDWSIDPYTCEDEHRHVTPLPYGHPQFRRPHLGGRLVWAGTETAEEGGGHMEGAVQSGEAGASMILGSDLARS